MNMKNVHIVVGAGNADRTVIQNIIAMHNIEPEHVVFVDNEIAHDLGEPEPYLLKPSPPVPELLAIEDMPGTLAEKKVKQHQKVKQYHQQNVCKRQLTAMNKNRKR
jgi:hypothetical protein